MHNIKLTAAGLRYFQQLRCLYAAAKSSEQLTLRQSLIAANLQLLIVFNDKNILKTYISMAMIALIAGLSVSQTIYGMRIFYGALVLAFSATISAHVATIISEYTQVRLKLRYLLWAALADLIILLFFFTMKPYLMFDGLWLVSMILSCLVIVFLTHNHFTETLHFKNFLKLYKENELIELLPRRIQGEILYLSSRDKYTLVVTDKGHHELRMPLNEAIKKNDQPGMRIHRCHWINKRYIAEPTRVGRRWFLVVEGSNLPISPKCVSNLKSHLENSLGST